MEGRVGDGDNLDAWEVFANALNFVGGGWNMDRVALGSLGELLHIFVIDDMVLNKVIARSNDANHDSLKFVLVVSKLFVG